MNELSSILFTGSHPDNDARDGFAKCLAGLPIKHPINPSHIVVRGVSIYGFRALAEDGKIHAYVAILRCGKAAVIRLAKSVRRPEDVRPFTLGGKVYVSYATGLAGGGKIRVNEVDIENATVGNDIHVVYPESKAREKNWAFWSKGDEVFALYRVSPTVVLKRVEARPSKWVFAEHYTGLGQDLPGVHIGSQMVEHEGRHFFMAHRHYPWGARGKSIYIGSLAQIAGPESDVALNPTALFHGVRTLALYGATGSGPVASVTYYAGLCIRDGVFRVSCGVNDRFSEFVSLPGTLVSQDPLPVASALTDWEVAASKSPKARSHSLTQYSPSQIELAEKRAAICGPCEHRDAKVRLKVETGAGTVEAYRVGCELCHSCGSNLSLVHGSCPEGKWPDNS